MEKRRYVMPEQTIYISLIIQALMLIAVIVLAILAMGQRGLRRDLVDQVGSKMKETEGAFDGKLTTMRQELDGKIGRVGETVVDWLGKQNQAFADNIDKMRNKVDESLATGRTELNQQLNNVTGLINQRLEDSTKQINQRLESNVTVIQEANKNFSQRIEASTSVLANLQKQIGQIEEAQKNISKVGLQVEELANILQAPKARGGFGEAFLADFLAQHLPQDHLVEGRGGHRQGLEGALPQRRQEARGRHRAKIHPPHRGHIRVRLHVCSRGKCLL
jgi:uncharacterized protein YukE